MGSRAAPFTMPALSFLGCVTAWDAHPFLRRRARDRVVLVKDHKKKKKVLPTLMNMALNAVILRPFTKAMAGHGLTRKPISLIKEALWKFYLQELPEEHKTEALQLTPKVRQTALYIQRMWTQITRKWSRWEMPRVPRMISSRFCLYVVLSFG